MRERYAGTVRDFHARIANPTSEIARPNSTSETKSRISSSMAAPQVDQLRDARRLSGIRGVARALVPRMTGVQWVAVGITAGFDAAPFFPLLGRVVMGFAQRLQVRRIEEQAQVAAMRAAMVDHSGCRVVALSQAHHAARMRVQMRGAQSAPA